MRDNRSINVGGNYVDNRSWHRVDNRGGMYAGRDLRVSTSGALADLDALARVLGELRLTDIERDEATRCLAAVRAAGPDRSAAGGALRRFTEILKGAGAIASAGAALIDPITRLAGWLGPIGAAVLALL